MYRDCLHRLYRRVLLRRNAIRVGFALLALAALPHTFAVGSDVDLVQSIPIQVTSAGSVARDGVGNFYFCGSFEGTVDFDAGDGEFLLTSAGRLDISIVKLNPSGEFLWAGALGGVNDDFGASIAVNRDGQIFLTGGFDFRFDLDPGPDVVEVSSEAGQDIFVVSLNTNGEFLWAATMGDRDLNHGTSIALDDVGDVLVAGYFDGTTDFDPGPDTYFLTAEKPSEFPELYPYANAFMLKLRSSGEFMWAKAISGPGENRAERVAAGVNGDFIVSGTFGGTVDLDPGSEELRVTSTESSEAFLLRLSESGQLEWAHTFPGLNFRDVSDVATDASGNVLLAGKFEGPLDVDPGRGEYVLTSQGDSDLFMLKLDRQGEFVWAASMGGGGSEGFDCSNEEHIANLAVDASGGIYATGYLSGIADMYPGPRVVNILGISQQYSYFLLKMDSDGSLEWFKTLGVISDSLGGDVVVDTAGTVYATGAFRGVVDGDPGPAYVEWATESDDDWEGFLWKLAPVNRNPSVLAQALLEFLQATDRYDIGNGQLDYTSAANYQPSLTHVEFNNWDANNDGFLTARELTARVEDTYGCFAAREEAVGGLSDAFVLGVALLALACSHVGFIRPSAYMD